MINPLPFILSRHWRNQGVLWTAVLSVLCLPVASEAMSLGRSRGAAIVGRPLDMSVLVSVDPQDATAEANCFNAEVFYGDTRINGQNISITPLRTSPTELTVRVRSSKPVDEPFVTLYLRATCDQNLSRKYVLLSDSPSEPAVDVPAVLPQVLAPQEPRLPRVSNSSGTSGASSYNPRASGSTTSSGVSDAASRALDRAARIEAKRLERDLQRQDNTGRRLQGSQGLGAESVANADGSFSPLPSRAPTRRKAPMQAQVGKKPSTQTAAIELKQSSRSRDRLALSPSLGSSGKAPTEMLKLDLLDANTGRIPNLRSSAELLTQPTTDEKARAQAATLWRVINSSPQDLLRDADRLKALEAEVGKMSELTKRQTQELGVVKADLVKANGERFANPLVYGLGALTLASLGFGLWAWRRRQTTAVVEKAPWWGGVEKAEEGIARGPRSIAMPSGVVSAGKKPASFAADPIAASLAPASGVTSYAPMTNDVEVVSDFDGFAEAAAENHTSPVDKAGLIRMGGDAADSGFGAGIGGGSSTRVNAEELFDIQQQADFFMSLGQHDQAIDVLQNHISDNLETSAVAYLDLFDIYHKVNKREEFDALRDEFNRVFNAQVPEFEHYGLSSRGLEDYAPAMQRIQALWPSAKVLDVIEESIFRKPDHDTQPFDLAAYRELMLLYGVAKEIGEPGAQRDDVAVDFDLTSPAVAQSGNPQVTGFSHTEVHPLSGDIVRGSAFGQLPAAQHLGLDIDLDIFDTSDTPNATGKVDVATASTPAAMKAVDFKLDMDNAINFDLTIDSKFMPPKKSK
jgi:hypothetical protein